MGLIRRIMDRAEYLAQLSELEEEYRKLRTDPQGIPEHKLENVRSLLAISRGDMYEACQRLDMIAKKKVKSRFFAVEEVDLEEGDFRRVYSNKPDELPVTDMRPIPREFFVETVVRQRALIVINHMGKHVDEIIENFPDYVQVSPLGCDSCVYLPVCESDKHELLGILAFFDKKDYFDKKTVNKIIKMREDACSYLGSVCMARNMGVADVKGMA